VRTTTAAWGFFTGKLEMFVFPFFDRLIKNMSTPAFQPLGFLLALAEILRTLISSVFTEEGLELFYVLVKDSVYSFLSFLENVKESDRPVLRKQLDRDIKKLFIEYRGQHHQTSPPDKIVSLEILFVIIFFVCYLFLHEYCTGRMEIYVQQERKITPLIIRMQHEQWEGLMDLIQTSVPSNMTETESSLNLASNAFTRNFLSATIFSSFYDRIYYALMAIISNDLTRVGSLKRPQDMSNATIDYLNSQLAPIVSTKAKWGWVKNGIDLVLYILIFKLVFSYTVIGKLIRSLNLYLSSSAAGAWKKVVKEKRD
jgi:hypothetical protein